MTRPTPRLDPYATFAIPPGKTVEQHLDHLLAFWAADSEPHRFAKALRAALRREATRTEEALGECGRLRRELATTRAMLAPHMPPRAVMTPATAATPLDPDTLAAELEDAA